MKLSSIVRRGALSGCAALLVSLAACSPQDASNGAPGVAGESEAQLMEKGTQLLYQTGDPVGAEATFRTVLAKNPEHYGAHYQLAVALDRGGRPLEARDEWTDVLRRAEAIKDSTTAQTARTRLAAPDTASQPAMMVRGLDLMYKQNNPTAAILQFESVLAKNRTHYGATYQMAVALDRAGRAGDAKRVWERVLPMAIQFKDQRTIDTARARLR